MSIPEQVRKQVERADELLRQVNGPAGQEDVGTPPATPPEAPEPEVKQPPVEPPASEPAPAAPAEPPKAPEPAPSSESTWEHKYKTLQGVFNAESRNWQSERRAFEDRLRTLESQAAPAPAIPAPSPVTPTTDKDLETYGPELLDLISRRATEMADKIVGARIAELKPQLDKTAEQVGQVATQVYQTQEDRFYGELTKLVPDYKAVNADPRWLAWLGEIDPLSGVPRQAYLDNASRALNHDHVATLFNAFKESAGLAKPEADPAPAPISGKPTPSPSPRTVGNASAPTHAEPVTGVGRSEIQAHYRRGSTDPSYRISAEHKAMEARIEKAMADNTILER